MRIVDAKYFGIKLSPNRIKNNKGQLIVTGCTFARTGKQKYHNSELGLEGEDFKYLDRPVEEVSSPATIASFEGAPLTLDHPEDDVKVGVNWNNLAKGLATNIKYVADSETSGHLEADLIFTDPDIINKVVNHEINELSAGYNCEVDEETWTQRKIRGNHIAIVECARAGHQAVIRDGAYKPVKKNMTVKIGDKEYHIVDSYVYELVDEEGKIQKFKDYLAYNDEGIKEAVKTVKIKPKKVVNDSKPKKVEDSDPIKKKNFIKEMAEKDYKVGHTFDPDDFNYFKKVCKEDGYKVTREDFDLYFEYLEDIRSNYFEDKEDVIPEQDIISKRKSIDQELRQTFSNKAFDVMGFYNGVESTEGSIFIVDYNPAKDPGFRKYRTEHLSGRYGKEELLDEAVYYIEKEYGKLLRGKYELDVFVTDPDDYFPITMHIYSQEKITLTDSNIDSELVNLLVAQGICGTKKEAKERVKNWTEEQKAQWMTSLKKKAKRSFYEDKVYNSILGVEDFLEGLLVREGDPNNKLGKTYIRALKNNEKLPRGVYFKAGTDTSGIIHYKGQDYYYYLEKDDSLVIEKY